jgi:hypothetical protein
MRPAFFLVCLQWKMQECISYLCTACQYVMPWELLNRFSWSLIVGSFTKICWHISAAAKMGQWHALHMKLHISFFSASWAQIAKNLLSKKGLKHKLQTKIKYILYPVHFLHKAYSFWGSECLIIVISQIHKVHFLKIWLSLKWGGYL